MATSFFLSHLLLSWSSFDRRMDVEMEHDFIILALVFRYDRVSTLLTHHLNSLWDGQTRRHSLTLNDIDAVDERNLIHVVVLRDLRWGEHLSVRCFANQLWMVDLQRH